MVSVILIWITIICITGCAGLIFMPAIRKVLGYRGCGIMPYLLTGLCLSVVYAQVYSLFGGVGMAADVILVLTILVMGFVFRKSVISEYKYFREKVKMPPVCILIGIGLFLLMAYGTSHGIMHYDTSLYHAQAIRWIEEYGVVFGLGNLHCRLGYNSAAFPLNALFSFAWFGGQSFHVTAGYCALLLAWECMGVKKNITGKFITVSLFARVMAVYYLCIIFDEMVSPASDYYMVCLAFILVIRWISETEDNTADTATYAMLTFLACFIVTVKLSGVIFVLCAIVPAYDYIRNKKWERLIVGILSGALIIAPYLIRNVYISGWLLYPSTALDIFDVDWKIPKGSALYDFKEIQVYGRGYTDVSRYEESITCWFGDWFASQSLLDRLIIVTAIVGVAYFVVKCLYYGFTVCRGRKPVLNKVYFMEAILCLCFLFWLFTSPLMRYGCLYVYLTAAVFIGEVCVRLSGNRVFRNIVAAAIVLLMTYKGVMLVGEICSEYRNDTWIMQQDYDNYQVYEYNIDGVTIYAPSEGDRTGYDAFPSSPWEMDIKLRGENLSDGFIPAE